MTKKVLQRNKQQTKNLILNSTRRVILERGIEKCGVNSIAAESGKNKVLIYRYFGGSHEIFKCLFTQFVDQLCTDLVEASRLQGGNAIKDYMLIIQTGLENRVDIQKLLRWELLHTETELARQMASLRGQVTMTFAELLPDLGLYQAEVLVQGIIYHVLRNISTNMD